MRNSFFNNQDFTNILEKPQSKSKLSSQMLFGESFIIIKKIKNFYKIRTNYDKYLGYIKAKKFKKNYKPTHKVMTLKSRIYKSSNGLKKTSRYLSFGSKIEILERKKNLIRYYDKFWIRKKDICPIKTKNRNIDKIFLLFKNCKYVWGGKTFDGIDCSALIQIFFYYNNIYFPRDTIDQIKFKKGLKKIDKFKKGILIYWKGHVAACLNSKKLVHAYGPRKKVVIMSILNTFKLIKRTANIKVLKFIKI